MKTEFPRLVLLVAALVALTACDIRYPSSRTDIPDERPSIAFTGAPEGSVVLVDGQEMGPAARYGDGINVLFVEPGNHIIQVRHGDQVLITRKIFLSGQATRTLVVR